MGKPVKAGDVLIELDPTIRRAELQRIEAQRDKLAALLPLLRYKEAGRHQLAERGAHPWISYYDDAQNLINAEHELRILQADYEAARQRLNYQTLTAPVNGTVEQLVVKI